MSLDKDIKVRGNKVYGRDTCLVVSMRINKAFVIRPKDADLPIGVKDRPHGKFAATLFYLDGQRYSMNFDDPMQAHRAWQLSKARLLMSLAEDESDEARPFIEARANLLIANADNGIETKGFI